MTPRGEGCVQMQFSAKDMFTATKSQQDSSFDLCLKPSGSKMLLQFRLHMNFCSAAIHPCIPPPQVIFIEGSVHLKALAFIVVLGISITFFEF